MQARHQATLTQPLQCDLQPRLEETHRTTHTGSTIVAKHIEGTKRPQPQPPHTRGTFHRRLQPLYTEKTHGFVLRLPPQNKAHATFMQPFQCDLQPQLQETHRTTHTGTTIVAKHIEGTKRPQPQPPHTRGTFHRRLQPLYTEKHKVSCSGFLPQNKAHATFMQPFQCDLQPQLQETHRTTHTGTTIVAKQHRRNQTTAAATAAHTRYLSSPAAATLHGKTQGFVLRLPPQLTTSLRHHFPYVLLCYVLFCDLPPFIKVNSTASYSFVIILLCYVLFCDLPPFIKVNSTASYSFVIILLCYVLFCDLPPFIKVNSTASYSFVMYCYAMYC